MIVLRSILLFILAALAEIGGAWLVWQGVREHRGLVFVGAGIVALGLYGFVATFQPDPHFGRILAAYGGVFVAGSLNGGVEWLLAHAGTSAYVSIAIVTLLYLYFYYDFAGYSDIAIGFGHLLGIHVPENFRRPFLATSITEFWRNWHITLVDWFRDQVFIPLGGMSAGRLRSGVLALLIMVLCGLWHGMTYSFLLWGTWHGTILFAEAVSGSKPVPPSRRHGWNYWLRVFWTNARVAIASVLFLPDTASSFTVLRGFAKWF